DPWAEGAHLTEEPQLALRPGDVHRMPCLSGGVVNLAQPGDDTEPRQERSDVLDQHAAARGEIDTRGTTLSIGPNVDAPVGGPEMPKEQGDLAIGQAEGFFWDSLLVGTLPEDSELSEPGIHTGGTPLV